MGGWLRIVRSFSRRRRQGHCPLWKILRKEGGGKEKGASTINNNIGGGVPVALDALILVRLRRHFSRALDMVDGDGVI